MADFHDSDGEMDPMALLMRETLGADDGSACRRPIHFLI
jgi:hypothetical protein